MPLTDKQWSILEENIAILNNNYNNILLVQFSSFNISCRVTINSLVNILVHKMRRRGRLLAVCVSGAQVRHIARAQITSQPFSSFFFRFVRSEYFAVNW